MSAKVSTPPSIRSLIPTVYAPSLLFGIGQGAVIPIVALTARDAGASVGLAAFAVALRGIGAMAFDVPSGWMIAKFGERRAMVIGTTILTVALLGCVLAENPWVFAMSMFLMGNGWSVWLTARLTYVSEVMPPHLRARSLSVLGGVQRIGNFVGPFVGALVIVGDQTDPVYLVHIALAVAGCIALVVIPDPHVASVPPPGHVPHSMLRIGREHRTTFATAGLVAGVLSVMRATRQVLLPLWAESIGLSAREVSILFGLSAALDMVVFYPAGSISDRFGRRAVAIPCLVLMGAGLAAVPLTDDFGSMLIVGLAVGLGNGFGSGLVMTLGADHAPPVGRAEFLGMWRLVGDVGTAGGPLVLSALEASVSLDFAAVVVGSLGSVGLAMMLKMPEPLHRQSDASTTTAVEHGGA